VPLTEDDDMVEAIAPHRADEPFHEGILPRTVGCREDFLDPQALHSVPEALAVDLARSRRRYDGAVSFGKASTICWAVHCEVG